MAWRYRLTAPFALAAAELAGVVHQGPWLQIADSRLSIAADYAWDGCSPSVKLGGLWLGTWDGPLGPDGRPVSWRASLVHDALCQFRPQLQGMTKAASVGVFARLLAEDAAPGWMQRLYPAAVDRFGPQQWA